MIRCDRYVSSGIIRKAYPFVTANYLTYGKIIVVYYINRIVVFIRYGLHRAVYQVTVFIGAAQRIGYLLWPAVFTKEVNKVSV